ncbi:hypothetical protein [Nocardioides panaciterrulae]|uniref:Uncharacterized protein n=1 Tax=Nocardioides panaciterrulae TaxID=661492 RepID=A0A7Y9E7G3_9ACTN|nr:hypothetical protein [Nocardioides panaciterrulae]NYD42543.1 hypothetical protein [Nocardioides panaciterrulae]
MTSWQPTPEEDAEEREFQRPYGPWEAFDRPKDRPKNRPKDRADLEVTWPRLGRAEQEWLRAAVRRLHPGHARPERPG